MTLIEVMLASAILALGLTMLLTAASRCLGVMRRSAEYQEAQWALRLAMLEHPIAFAEDIREQDVAGEEYEGYVFTREIEDEDEDGLYVVRHRVTWGSDKRPKFEELLEYVYQEPEEEE